MNSILTRQLVARHPKLLAMPQDSVIAERGIECCDGWYAIIDEMLTGIEQHYQTIGSSPLAITQIKEKFGLLRVYTSHSDESIRAILDAAEQRSAMCCERCGREGKLVASPFRQVTCEDCYIGSTV